MWTKQQIATFQRALAASQKWEKVLEYLSELAKHSPQFADRIAELQIRAANVQNLSNAALTMAAASSQG